MVCKPVCGWLWGGILGLDFLGVAADGVRPSSTFCWSGVGSPSGGFFGAACRFAGCLPAGSLLVWRPLLLPCFNV